MNIGLGQFLYGLPSSKWVIGTFWTKAQNLTGYHSSMLQYGVKEIKITSISNPALNRDWHSTDVHTNQGNHVYLNNTNGDEVIIEMKYPANTKYLHFVGSSAYKMDFSNLKKLEKLKLESVGSYYRANGTVLETFPAFELQLPSNNNIKLFHLQIDNNVTTNIRDFIPSLTNVESLYLNNVEVKGKLDLSNYLKINNLIIQNSKELEILNIANGNNMNFIKNSIYFSSGAFNSENNPKLRCIKIDQAFIPPTTGTHKWKKDNHTNYRNDGTDCPDTPVNVSINPSNVTREKGLTTTLNAQVLPVTAYQDVNWSTDNANIATVDSTGKVTMLEVGTATITATTQINNLTSTSLITVTPPTASVTGIVFDNTDYSISIGDNQLLSNNIEIQPRNSANKTVTWSSSNPAVATIDNTGKVVGVAIGTTTITVTTQDGNFTANCVVTVKKLPKITFTTTNAIGSSLANVGISASTQHRPNVWIDLNNNGNKDTGEQVTTFGRSNYVIASQTISVFGVIKELYLTDSTNKINSIDVSENVGLERLYITRNLLTAIDVTKNVLLERLYLDKNNLTVIDVSKNTVLERLYLRDNSNLTTIYVNQTQLTKLNAGQLPRWRKPATANYILKP